MTNSAYNSEWKTLTHAVKQILPDPMFFQQRFGSKPAITSPTTTSEFDVVKGRRDLAPMGHPGDPATRVDYTESFETFVVTPPQIFLEDPLKANVLASMRMPGQSPYLTGSGAQSDLSSAFMQHVAIKQRNMVNAIARRKEWMWAQMATTGKIDYVDSNGRRFKVDCGVPDSNIFENTEKWTTADVEPIFHLHSWRRTYVEQNGVLPTDYILGQEAADAFRNNKAVHAWMKSAGVQLLQLNMGQSETLVTPIATIPGIGTLYEHSGKYPADNGGGSKFYMPSKSILMTNPTMFQMHYGAIHDFDINPEYPLLQGEMFSKMKISHDGKHKSVFVESHPLPVLEFATGIMVIQVVADD